MESLAQENNFYNYITKNRILNDENNQVAVKMSVDLVTLSINKIHFNKREFYNLFNVFRKHSIKPSEYILKKNYRFSQYRIYYIAFNGKNYKVEALNCPYSASLPVVLTIHDSTRELLQYLQPYLKQLKHKISQAEFTLDFIGNRPQEMYQFFKQHLLLSNPSKKILNLKYDTTFYRNNIRKSRGKGLKCYWKKICIGENNKYIQAIRVELTMVRELLKTKQVNDIDQFLNINTSIPLKYLLFKTFNYNKFINKLKELEYDREFIDKMLIAIRNDIKNGFLYESNIIAKTYYKNGSLTYLNQHDFHKYFLRVILDKSFINGDIFAVDFGKMVCC